MTYSGKLILVVGSSGSGKGVLMKRAKALHPEIVFPGSATTRPMRPSEKEGETYNFITKEEFTRRVDAGEFLEWANIDGKCYGTPKSEVLPPLEAGKVVIDEMDVQGVRQILSVLPREQVVTIYIDAGGWAALARRIQGRAPISEAELESRRQRFEYEQHFRDEADYVVENCDGKFKEADAAFETIISNLLLSA